MRTVGTVHRDEARRAWVIDCEAHAAIVLRRVFLRCTDGAAGTLLLGDTPEMAQKLTWFLEGYPMDVRDGGYLRDRAASHRAQVTALDDLCSGKVSPPPFDLASPARDYQRLAGAALLLAGGMLLADDVGLGKTVSAITTFTDPRMLPVVVVTLTHLPRQWEIEIKRFAPSLRVLAIEQGTPYDLAEAAATGRICRPRPVAQQRIQGSFPDVVVISYSKLGGWADTLSAFARGIVFDEVQELRNRGSEKYKAAARIARATTFRLGLSATPIYNYGGEIFSVLDVLRPDALGTWDEFCRDWCGGYSQKPSILSPKAFGSYARETGLMLRRTRAEVGRELPALTQSSQWVDTNETAFDEVGASCVELAQTILKTGRTEHDEKFLASGEFTSKLRQATGRAKAPHVAAFVRPLVESGERVVLFGWHREVFDHWMEALRDLKPELYTGSETPAQKETSRARFLSGESRLLLMSLRAGAGLDGLQKVCRTVVFGELDWSPGVHEQCEGRVYRDGQAEPVLAYYLVADAGADPVIADVLRLKREQVDGLRDPNGALVERLTSEGDRVKQLAAAFLVQRGVALPNSEAA